MTSPITDWGPQNSADFEPPYDDDDGQEPELAALDAEQAAAMAEIRYNEAVSEKVRQLKIHEAAKRRMAREQEGNQPRPTLARLDRFLGAADDDPTYRVDRIWPTGGRVLLAAQAKAGKTTIVGNLIRSLVDAEPFLDTFDAKPALRVVLIDNELDPRTLRRWLKDQGVTNQVAVELLSLRGRVSAFNILDPTARTEWANDLAGADVIILDCLRPLLDAFGLDENHDAGRFLVAFDALLADSGATEAVIVHHMGHGPERARGDSRLQDWPDAVWKLVRDKDEDDDTLDDVTGSRYFSAFGRDVNHPQTELLYNPESRRLTLASTSRNRRDTTAERKIMRIDNAVLEAVTAQPGINKSKLRRACAQHGSGRNPDIDAAVERLVTDGLIIRKYPGNQHLHYPNTDPQLQDLPNMPNHAQGSMGGIVPMPIGMGTTPSPSRQANAPTPRNGHDQTKPCPTCNNPIPSHHNKCEDCAQAAITQARPAS